MDAWLKTHAPRSWSHLEPRGGLALAEDPDAVRGMLRLMRHHLAAMPTPAVPRGFAALQTLPQGPLVAVLRRFLRSPTAAHSGLGRTSEAPELARLAEQMRAYEGRETEPAHSTPASLATQPSPWPPCVAIPASPVRVQ